MKKNYYAILPANVRYDKNLSPNAKLLYAEITALCNEKGYCWATNRYFMDLYSISERQIQRLLQQLVLYKYIYIVIEKNTKRKIFIINYTPDKNVEGSATKMSGEYDKNVTHNIIKNIKSEYPNNTDLELFDYDWINEKD